MRWQHLLLPATLVLTAAVPPLSRPVFVDGFKFTWKTSGQYEGKKRPPGAQPSMSVQLAGARIRMDFLEPSGNPMLKKGGYMIMDAEKNKLIMVSPADKKAMVMDPSAMGAMANAMGQSGLVKMEIDNVKVDVVDLGAGERLLGRSTHRYRISRSYDMSMRIMGMSRNSHHESVSEAWLTNDFLGDRAFEAFGRQFANRMAATGGAFAKLIEAEAKSPKGFPMKMTVTSTDTDDKGKAVTSTVTTEVTELTKADIDPSVFEVPAGYETIDMGAQLKDAQAKMEEAKAECEQEKGKGNCERPNADSAMKTGAKEGGKDAAKKAIKGLFRKP